ncbi:cytochrome P450 [Penicillium lividum]|nr:cytochrome P450 [Penicillium lividum]
MLILELPASLILKVAAVGWIQYLVIKAIYNVFFHPLKDYPGPRTMAASRLPITYARLAGHSVYLTLQLHQKYGHVVRMGPNELSYSDSSSWKDIYASHPSRPGGMPPERSTAETFERKDTTRSLVNVHGKEHSRMRRAYGRALTKQALLQQEPLILEHILDLTRKLDEQKHDHINIEDLFTFLVADITIQFQLGSHLHILDDTTRQPWVKSMIGMIRNSTILGILAEFPLLGAIFQLVLPLLMKQARNIHFGWMTELLDDRFATEADRPDLVHFVINHTGAESSVSEAEFRANAPILFLAQTETTTTALSGLIALLLSEPFILSELQTEVRSNFRTISDINMAVIERMKVLNACISEVLRVYPPGPSSVPHVVPQGGGTISGRWVPGGTRVYNSMFATFRSSENFHDPDLFLPQRWYKETDEQFLTDDKASCRPFSMGPTECPGRQ